MKGVKKSPPAPATPITLLAFGSRDSGLLEMIIQRFLVREFVLVSQDRAAAAIVDGDAHSAKKAIAAWHISKPDAPVVSITLTPDQDTPLVRHCRRPIDVDALVAVLKTLRKHLQQPAMVETFPNPDLKAPSAPVGAKSRSPAEQLNEPVMTRSTSQTDRPLLPFEGGGGSNVTPTRQNLAPAYVAPLRAHANVPCNSLPTRNAEGRDYCGSADDMAAELLSSDHLRGDQAVQLYFDPDARLLSLLRLAGKLCRISDRAISIIGLERPLVLLPNTPTSVRSPVKDLALRPLCNTTLFSETMTVGPVTANHPEDVIYDFGELLWKVALWTARGRLPRQTDPNSPVGLRGMPDFSRLTPTPHAESICALWSQDRTLSPVMTANHLGIAQRYVFGLYSALSALDFLESPVDTHLNVLPVAPDKPQVTGFSPPSQRSLLEGILMKLDHDA
jgi:hypothetical protein